MAPLRDFFTSAKDAKRFYENYSFIRQWIQEPGKKVILRSTQPGVCRFCCLRAPKVTFKNEAHAIPECTGNRSLFTDYECDDCNRFFGIGIENDFGNWSKAQRALSGVKGKKKRVPALKGGSTRPWRFEHDSAGIRVTQDEGDPIAVVNEATEEFTLTVPQDPYTPVAVLKAFTKMALSLLPEEELPNFRRAMSWIRNTDHQVGLVKTSSFPVLYTFVPGNDPFENSAVLLRRKTDDLPLLPYAMFVLFYGNEVFQTIVPSPERDAAISQNIPYFPNAYELGYLQQVAPMRREPIDLTGRCLVKGETIQTVMRYKLRTRDD
jgi:hypothetical protein